MYEYYDTKNRHIQELMIRPDQYTTYWVYNTLTQQMPIHWMI